jgi:hypothetical protein
MKYKVWNLYPLARTLFSLVQLYLWSISAKRSQHIWQDLSDNRSWLGGEAGWRNQGWRRYKREVDEDSSESTFGSKRRVDDSVEGIVVFPQTKETPVNVSYSCKCWHNWNLTKIWFRASWGAAKRRNSVFEGLGVVAVTCRAIHISRQSLCLLRNQTEYPWNVSNR